MSHPALPDTIAMLAIAGVSTSGKDTLTTRLLSACPDLQKTVTSTTRPPREYEVSGTHYHFYGSPVPAGWSPNDALFRERVDAGAFLEHAEVHGKWYGLERAELERIHGAGRHPVTIMDVQGVRTVSAAIPVARVFIDVPVADVERRLRTMRPDHEIPGRLASMQRELAERPFYHRLIANPDGGLEQAVADLVAFYEDVIRPRMQAYIAQQISQPATRPARLRAAR